MRIEIKSAEVIKETGSFDSFHQVGRLVSDDEIRKFKIGLRAPEGKTPAPRYPVGVYDLSPDSFVIDRYGKLSLGNLTLLPVAAAGK